jgi:photosystem II stability/assembly factor-like uncharacterized protein
MLRKLLPLIACCFVFLKTNAQLFEKQNTSIQNLLHSLSFSNGENGYVCGDGGIILKTTNGGSNWVKVNTNTNKDLWDIKIFPNTEGKRVLCVGDQKTIIQSMDGGINWKILTNPLPSSAFVFGVWLKDTSDYWITGGDFTCLSGYVLHTKDGGKTWAYSCIPNTLFLEEIVFIDENRGFVCGINASNEGVLFKTVDGGTTWTFVNKYAGILNTITAVNQNDIYCGSDQGVFIQSHDGGKTWADRTISSNIGIYNVYFQSTNHGYICGIDNTDNTGFVYETFDGGKTWNDLEYTLPWAWAVQSIGDKLFVCGDKGTIAVRQNTNAVNGPEHVKNWMAFPNPAQNYIYVNSVGNLKSLYKLYALSGNLVLAGELSHDNKINVSFLPNGMYWLHVSQLHKNEYIKIQILH